MSDLQAIFDRYRNLPPPLDRKLDPVRAAALAQAIELCRVTGTASPSEIVDNAEIFEGYLAGRIEIEADGHS